MPREHPRLAAAPGDPRRAVLADAHVHIHDCFRLAAFLSAAAANFRSAAGRLGLPPAAPGCLMLAESPPADAFTRLHAITAPDEHDGWTIRDTAEAGTLIAERPGSTTLFIFAGRQIATSDGLEVLALLTARDFAVHLPLQETIDLVRAAGAIPVVPWGFGKWTLQRRRRVARALRSAPRPLFVGDNGGRSRIGREPRLFAAARAGGLLILPGSDPLPFADQQNRAGSYGFIADVPPGEMSAARLREWLLGTSEQPRVYGARERTTTFVRNQIRMQIRKRVG